MIIFLAISKKGMPAVSGHGADRASAQKLLCIRCFAIDAFISRMYSYNTVSNCPFSYYVLVLVFLDKKDTNKLFN